MAEQHPVQKKLRDMTRRALTAAAEFAVGGPTGKLAADLERRAEADREAARQGGDSQDARRIYQEKLKTFRSPVGSLRRLATNQGDRDEDFEEVQNDLTPQDMARIIETAKRKPEAPLLGNHQVTHILVDNASNSPTVFYIVYEDNQGRQHVHAVPHGDSGSRVEFIDDPNTAVTVGLSVAHQAKQAQPQTVLRVGHSFEAAAFRVNARWTGQNSVPFEEELQPAGWVLHNQTPIRTIADFCFPPHIKGNSGTTIQYDSKGNRTQVPPLYEAHPLHPNTFKNR